MLYADFVKESYGRECIETENGFITFSVTRDVCHIDTLFVSRETRGTGGGRKLFNDMLSTLPDEVTLLTCEVDTRSRVCSESLSVILGCGFKILDIQSPYIRIYKRIRGE